MANKHFINLIYGNDKLSLRRAHSIRHFQIQTQFRVDVFSFVSLLFFGARSPRCSIEFQVGRHFARGATLTCNGSVSLIYEYLHRSERKREDRIA